MNKKTTKSLQVLLKREKVYNRKDIPLLFAITSLGISSVISQITITRELLNIFLGSELVVGLIISVWLILTGVGALLGRIQRYPQQTLAVSLVMIALLPFIHLILLRLIRNIAAVPGAVVDLRILFIYLPLLIFPYCLLSGYMLTLACSLFTAGNKAMSFGAVYFIDNLGDILGGALFSFILVFTATNFNSLYVPGILNVLAAILVCWHYRCYKAMPALAGLLLLIFLSIKYDLDSKSIARLYPHQRITHVKESPYGRIVVTKDAEQYNFFENGIPFLSTGDVRDAEETVHFALSQLPERELKVLLISGGVGEVPMEILKYPVERIDYVELDPEVIAAGDLFIKRNLGKKLRVYSTDGRAFIEQIPEIYDAVIIDLPPPSNIQINRFYTMEFFMLLKHKLTPDGLVSFSLPGAENYISQELSELYKVIYSTAKKAFKQVLAYPASKTVFVLSDVGLGYGIDRWLQKKKIPTKYINAFYLKGMLTGDRLKQLNEHMALSEMLNKDLHPVAFRFQLKYWLSFFDLNISWILIMFVAGGILFLVFNKPVEATLWTTGFASVSLEIIILVLFQVYSGCLYFEFGLMLTLFMAGLSIGSFAANRTIASRAADGELGRRALIALETIFVVYIGVFAAVTGLSGIWKSKLMLYLFILIVSVLTGAEFPFAGISRKENVEKQASRLYAADFLGAGFGSFLCAVLLLPALGVMNTALVLLVLKLVSLSKLVRMA